MFDTFREPHFFTFSVIFSHIASIFTFSVEFFSHLATFSHIAAFSHLRVPQTPPPPSPQRETDQIEAHYSKWSIQYAKRFRKSLRLAFCVIARVCSNSSECRSVFRVTIAVNMEYTPVGIIITCIMGDIQREFTVAARTHVAPSNVKMPLYVKR